MLQPDVLRRLRRLHLDWGIELNSGHAGTLAECRALTGLRASTCRLASLAPLSRCTALQSLELGFAETDKEVRLDLSHLTPCTALATLHLAGFVRVLDLCPLSALSASLTSLHVTNCLPSHQGHLLSQLLPLTQLRLLAVSLDTDPPAGQPTAAKLLSDLASSLPRLTALDINLDCMCAPDAYLPTLEGLDGQRIRHLALAEGWGGHKLALAAMPAAGAAALRTLRLNGFDGFDDLGALAACKALARLELHSTCYNEAAGLAPLSNLMTLELQRLHICNCPYLRDIWPLAALTALRELSLRECPRVTDLEPLTSLESLRVLCIGDCRCGDVRSCKHLAGVRGLDLLLEARPGLRVQCADWLAVPPM